ncbi:hypothetical protein IU462_31525, partial [Nocardia farcinica]|uniref:GltB/FmdC/FwdC-like GXGXG domain-containing protein n=1 Tax=Nocardia farcinica TaxID=37329 RepID=UPI001E4C8984
KAYREKVPVIVIGGSTGDFTGEYMAGGIIVILGLYTRQTGNFLVDAGRGLTGNYTGTGMHGGMIYIRGDVDEYRLGNQVKKMALNDMDEDIL